MTSPSARARSAPQDDVGPAAFAAERPSSQRHRVFLLKSRPFGTEPPLPYRVETIERAGLALRFTDAIHRPPWTLGPVRGMVRRLERLGAPFLQTLLATRAIGRSTAVVAMFESQGNFLAALRALRVWPFTRPRFVLLSCWLAETAPRFGPRRRRWYAFTYRRGVDHLVYFSSNQTAVYRELLGLPEDRLVVVPFGVDHEYFTPQDVEDEGYVLAVGRDKGRDWPTFFDAVRGTALDVRLACRPDDIAGLDVPPNVTVLGFVERDQYRDLTARARVVVVPTRVLPYPTGQSVTLESMAMGRCCVVTDTPAMREYIHDGEDALAVAPGDVAALRRAIERAMSDADLRKRLGVAAREAVEQRFNAPAMWATIGALASPPG